MIEGIRGVDYKGDISIDDIEIADHACSAPCEYLAVGEEVHYRYSPEKLFWIISESFLEKIHDREQFL